MKKILVPLDGSDNSLRAIGTAAEMAGMSGSEITALYVIDQEQVDRGIVHLPMGDVMDEFRRLGNVILNKAEKEFAGHGTNIKKKIVVGIPYRAIVDQAAEYDMIVMCTHGRSALQKAFLGSVADKVIRLAECPVLTVR